MKTVFSVVLGFALAVTAFAQQEAPQGRGGRGGRGGQAGPPPRILSFEARPASIRPGESTVLVWSTENPSGITIDPEVGSVAARGNKVVSPAATTTYTLSMRGGPSKTVSVTVAGAPVARPNAATGGNGNAGRFRMADGKPDLTGVYGNAGLPAGTKAPPLKPGADKFVIVRGPNDVRGRTTLGTDCKPLGIPQTYITPYPFQFVQNSKLLVIIYEYPNAIRWIPLDGRPHPDDPDPTWMGNSVGHWEGDTLVVDVIGFNDKTEVHGFMHTTDLHVVERFKRLENGDLQYDVTVEDPNVWTAPWVIPARTFRFRPEEEWVDEFICDANVDYNRLFKKD
jgi:hypothetical protein